MPLVYADDHVLVLDKPAGELTVPGRGADKQACLWQRVLRHYPDALVVHRLDMATSGLVVFARGLDVQRQLNRCFEQRLVHKTYEAVVQGLMGAGGDGLLDEGRIDLPLAADWPRRPRQQVDRLGGKPSLTHWQVLARDANQQRTRLRLTPISGRSHQLRVHLWATGHAILGDVLYGDTGVAAAAPRLLLHATSLAFPSLGTESSAAWKWQSAAPF